MRINLLLAMAVTSTCFALPSPYLEQENTPHEYNVLDDMASIVNADLLSHEVALKPLPEIKDMLHKEAPTLHSSVIDKVISSIECTLKYNIENNHVLTIIDYSLPSSEKRLWVFDLNSMKLLFHTYVSHGIKSGTLLSNYFSNKYNSKSSSIGVYRTEKTYYGRDGLSLRLDGLEQGFNSNASNRSVVMHGSWYVEEPFIKKYGRAGRSWGCPALPLNLTKPIINTIKDSALFVVYYPSDDWLAKSKFLNCMHPSSLHQANSQDTKPLVVDNELRDAILFARIGKNNYHGESEPIVAMTADNYMRIFHTKAPLERMLRRQIGDTEYIALSTSEFKNLATIQDPVLQDVHKNDLNAVCFVVPVLTMRRGYYLTEMHIVPLGTIKEITFNTTLSEKTEQSNPFTIHFEQKPSISLRSTNQFIRWLGL